VFPWLLVAAAGAPPPKFANGSEGAEKLIGFAAGAAGATGAAGAAGAPPGPPNIEKISPPPLPNIDANIELKSKAFPCAGGACWSAGGAPPTRISIKYLFTNRVNLQRFWPSAAVTKKIKLNLIVYSISWFNLNRHLVNLSET